MLVSFLLAGMEHQAPNTGQSDIQIHGLEGKLSLASALGRSSASALGIWIRKRRLFVISLDAGACVSDMPQSAEFDGQAIGCCARVVPRHFWFGSLACIGMIDCHSHCRSSCGRTQLKRAFAPCFHCAIRVNYEVII